MMTLRASEHFNARNALARYMAQGFQISSIAWYSIASAATLRVLEMITGNLNLFSSSSGQSTNGECRYGDKGGFSNASVNAIHA